jgi:osmoprotectant transport system substrate-binding protein
MVSRTTLRRRARIVAAALAALAVAGISACSGSSSSGPATAATSAGSSGASNPLAPSGANGSVVVGSANFPENELIAEIYILALQAKGVKVTPKLNIGAREVYYPQVTKGAISIIPEYNGTLLSVAVDPKSTAKSTAAVDAALAAKLPSTLTVLSPAPAEDSDSIAVTAATAARYHLKTIADLKAVAATLALGAPPEFKTRTDGVVGLRSTYGLNFKSFVPLDESGPVTLSALTSGKVQAADVFTTTPQIISDKLVPLADPKFLFAAQNVVPLVYKPALTPVIAGVLNSISAKLTTNALLQMDAAVITQHANYTTVAAGFLKAEGLS